MSPGRTTWMHRGAWYVTLLALSGPFLFPFLWMVSSAFKGPGEIFAFPPQLIPDRWHWQNFVEIFRYQPFARQYANSLYVAILVTFGTLAVATRRATRLRASSSAEAPGSSCCCSAHS